MQFNQIRAFVAVAETLNVSRAAERLRLAQSSVSEQIAALELSLGARLLDRRRRRLELTEAGKRLLPYARHLLDTVNDARAAVTASARDASGHLRIGTLETIASRFLPKHLVAFRADYPEVSVSLQTLSSGAALSLLRAGDLDCVIVIGPPPDDAGLRSATVSIEPVVAAFPLGATLRCGAGGPDLSDATVIATHVGCVFRAIVDRIPSAPPVAMEVESLSTLLSLVEVGAGIAILPQMAAHGSALVTVPLVGEQSRVLTTLVWRRHRFAPPAFEAFRARLAHSHQPMSAVGM